MNPQTIEVFRKDVRILTFVGVWDVVDGVLMLSAVPALNSGSSLERIATDDWNFKHIFATGEWSRLVLSDAP